MASSLAFAAPVTDQDVMRTQNYLGLDENPASLLPVGLRLMFSCRFAGSPFRTIRR